VFVWETPVLLSGGVLGHSLDFEFFLDLVSCLAIPLSTDLLSCSLPTDLIVSKWEYSS
jgi:hypothetical protein